MLNAKCTKHALIIITLKVLRRTTIRPTLRRVQILSLPQRLLHVAIDALIRVLPTTGIHRPTHHIALHLRVHCHLIILLPQRCREAIMPMPRLHRGQEINDETPDVKDVDQRYGPLQDRGAVVVSLVSHYAERDGEGQFNEDESKLDPEAVSEDAILAVVDS